MTLYCKIWEWMEASGDVYGVYSLIVFRHKLIDSFDHCGNHIVFDLFRRVLGDI
jgi:hypothetical protein